MALEEVKLLQKQRQRKVGIPAMSNANSNLGVNGLILERKKVSAKDDPCSSSSQPDLTDVGNKHKDVKDNDDLVLQDTFAQETTVMLEDPNMLKYEEQGLAKKRRRKVDDAATQDQVDNYLKRAEDDLYKIPHHLKVKKRNSVESSAQWTTGIAEMQVEKY